MKIKAGASIEGLDLRMRPALIQAERIWKEHGHELVITCGLNGEHSAGSWHYYGLAVDMRTHYFDEPELVRDELRVALGDRFDVILERDHMHVEYEA